MILTDNKYLHRWTMVLVSVLEKEEQKKSINLKKSMSMFPQINLIRITNKSATC